MHFLILTASLLLLSFTALAEEKTNDIKTPLPAEKEAEIKKEVRTYDEVLNSRYGLFPHRGTFLLPFTYNATPDQSLYQAQRTDPEDQNNGDYNRHVEAEFQVSFLVPIYRKIARTEWDLITAYTHHAWWQLYNARWSRPFRETNYSPELFARRIFTDPPGLGQWRLLAFDAGYIHQSNGQIKEQSRSWDRLFVRSATRYYDTTMVVALWYRIPEKKVDDDNSSIHKYLGIGEFDLTHNFGKHTLGFHTPIAWNYYSLEVRYSIPWRDQWRFYTSVRSGYGHSLNDYNHETQRIGVGIILSDSLD